MERLAVEGDQRAVRKWICAASIAASCRGDTSRDVFRHTAPLKPLASTVSALLVLSDHRRDQVVAPCGDSDASVPDGPVPDGTRACQKKAPSCRADPVVPRQQRRNRAVPTCITPESMPNARGATSPPSPAESGLQSPKVLESGRFASVAASHAPSLHLQASVVAFPAAVAPIQRAHGSCIAPRHRGTGASRRVQAASLLAWQLPAEPLHVQPFQLRQQGQAPRQQSPLPRPHHPHGDLTPSCDSFQQRPVATAELVHIRYVDACRRARANAAASYVGGAGAGWPAVPGRPPREPDIRVGSLALEMDAHALAVVVHALAPTVPMECVAVFGRHYGCGALWLAPPPWQRTQALTGTWEALVADAVERLNRRAWLGPGHAICAPWHGPAAPPFAPPLAWDGTPTAAVDPAVDPGLHALHAHMGAHFRAQYAGGPMKAPRHFMSADFWISG